MSYKKIILTIIVASGLLWANTACTKTRDDSPQDNKSMSYNAADEKKTDDKRPTPLLSPYQKVFKVVSVDKNVAEGKSVNFVWNEDGKDINFRDFTKDKVVFLNFWGTWCPPCRGEIPDIVELSKELEKNGLIVMGVALEQDKVNAANRVKSFSEKNSIPYRNFIGGEELTMAYGGINAVPTTFIIDREGNIVEKLVGGMTKDQFMDRLKGLIPIK
ncbi:MAG: TlpA family protein disulfide reductase [Chloroflexota bacterium]